MGRIATSWDDRASYETSRGNDAKQSKCRRTPVLKTGRNTRIQVVDAKPELPGSRSPAGRTVLGLLRFLNIRLEHSVCPLLCSSVNAFFHDVSITSKFILASVEKY